MSSIKIRCAETSDAELIADMSRQTFYDTFAAVNTKEDMDKFMNEQFSRDSLIKQVGAPGYLFLLAYENDEPLGYACTREGEKYSEFNNHSSIEIARIYATQTAIGKGVGKALMQECIKIAKEMNRDIIWLGVWEKNYRAIDFYKKWGFEKFAEHDFVLGNDVQTDWLMSKRIDNSLLG
ncbi:MAG TPA: GNAT family N-acetyltransferase [Ignavibacteriaceae bacterium]